MKGWKYESRKVEFKDIKSSLKLALNGTTWNKKVPEKLTQWICNTKRTIANKDVKEKLLEFGIVEGRFSDYNWLVKDNMEKQCNIKIKFYWKETTRKRERVQSVTIQERRQ